MDISIIIVNYNTCELTRNCLNSIFKQTKNVQFEIIVSDNGSADNSVEMIKTEFPQVILIENKKNLGFGAANNQALKIAKGQYILFLNSDTLFLNNALKMLIDYWENSPIKENIGGLGCNLLHSDMTINTSFGCFPTFRTLIKKHFRHVASAYIKPFIYFLLPKHKEINKYTNYVGEVDFITGADLFLLNNENAYFDEKFFMYFEETDLQYNLSRKGLKRIIIDGPQIIHLDGGSFGTQKKLFYNFTSNRSFYSNESSVIYLQKNDPNKLHFKLLRLLLVLVYILPWNLSKAKYYIKRLYDI